MAIMNSSNPHEMHMDHSQHQMMDHGSMNHDHSAISSTEGCSAAASHAGHMMSVRSLLKITKFSSNSENISILSDGISRWLLRDDTLRGMENLFVGRIDRIDHWNCYNGRALRGSQVLQRVSFLENLQCLAVQKCIDATGEERR